MKKKIRRLRLERETLRNLTPEQMDAVAGGNGGLDSDTRYNSCNFVVRSICLSCFPLIC